MSGAWGVEAHQGSAAEFHARTVEEPARRAVWWSSVDRPALVLGSAQRPEVADADALAAAGVELVRRRSGGGAVLLVPGEVVWADVIVPAGDPLWDDDVGRATHWLGRDVGGGARGVRAARRRRSIAGRWSARRGRRSSASPVSDRARCRSARRKVVGISQRRTRGWARFQCAAYLRWDPAALVALLAAAPPRGRRAGRRRPRGARPSAAALRAAFEAALP